MRPIPQEIRLNSTHDTLNLIYADQIFSLPAEFLRVYSPSAEVRGHSMGNEVLQTGKLGIKITDLTATGNYALKITFSDGHDSGLYDWDYLYKLGEKQAVLWANYLARLDAAGESREPQPQNNPPKKAHSCDGCH